MPEKSHSAEKILGSIKGLRDHLQTDEEPRQALPAIWDGGQSTHSTPSDAIVTNQRLIGYRHVHFPRERLFFDAIPLSEITGVSFRQKTHEPIFRELRVNAGPRTIYIRAPRKKLESLYTSLREAIENETANTSMTAPTEQETARPTPVYGRQDIRTPFERSPLAIVVLFVGGLILEITGITLWISTHNQQTGLPLCAAGALAVIAALITRRQRG